MNKDQTIKTPFFRWMMFVLDLIVIGALYLLYLFLTADGHTRGDKSLIKPLVNLLLTIIGVYNLVSQFMHILLFAFMTKWVALLRLFMFALSMALTVYILYCFSALECVLSDFFLYRISPIVALAYLMLTFLDFNFEMARWLRKRKLSARRSEINGKS